VFLALSVATSREATPGNQLAGSTLPGFLIVFGTIIHAGV
jgi:hypothetical protein